MAIDVKISDGAGTADTAKHAYRPTGLVVYTEPFASVITQSYPALSTTYGANMNQNVTFGGTPDGIHNGTDSVLWTGSAISGTWVFNSAVITPQDGSACIDATPTVDGNEALFTRGSTISTGSYTALTGYIYVTAWPGSGTKEVEVRFRNGGTDQGVTLPLSSYIDETSFGAWQKFTIPIVDFEMGTVSIDEMVVQTVDIGGGAAPDYYLDNMRLEETGSPEQFVITPNIGKRFYVTELCISVVDAYAGTLADATMPRIPYNTILAESALTNGITITLETDNVTRFSTVFRQHMDLAQVPGIVIQSGSDGTNTWINYTFKYTQPLCLDARTGDNITYTVNDNLSGLIHLRAFSQGYEETII